MTRTTSDTEFLDLVLGDEDLLRDEFEAIIAASWQEPPPRRPALPGPGDRLPTWPVARPGHHTARLPTEPNRRLRGRQRAPPDESRR